MNTNNDSTKTTTRTISIDDMKGETCIRQVTTALGSVKGIATKSLSVGSATLACDNDAACDAAVKAITAAGFPAKSVKSESVKSASVSSESVKSGSVMNESASGGSCCSTGDKTMPASAASTVGSSSKVGSKVLSSTPNIDG